MAHPLFLVRTPKIMRIVLMGNITVYMVHTVAPQRLMRYIIMLLDNGQYHAFP